MASTYSTLKIQLMATGENNTTWGNVTNTNLGTAIEEAIVGSEDVTFASANVTLTLTDTNASQTARNLRLRCIGTTGGVTRNLVVPSIEKPYIIQNECSDSILVKTAAGTGVTVPAGKTMWVYTDGTNVVDVVTHISSVTLGTPLAVASGGTGANSASGARTALGLGTISTQNASSVTITGGSITGITDLAIADGGTGASDAAGARTNLGLGTLATLSSINNSNWSGTDLAIANGGTGASDAGTARTNLGLGSLATLNSINNSNWSGTALSIANGGTGATDAATARANLGAGTGNGTVTSISGTGTVNGLTLTGTVTSSGSLTLGGALTGVNLSTQVTGTLPVANGGTGATTAATARANLGAGTVNSVSGTGTVNGLTLTGTVTSSGSLTLGGTLSGINLASQVTGVLPIANGGTGSNTASGARTALGAAASGANTDITSLSPAAGLVVGSPTGGAQGAGTINTSGIFIDGVPVASGGGGSVTSVNASTSVSGLSFTGGPITTSGTLSLSGTVGIASGGTGATTASAARTNLGATTIGGALFTFANTNAIRFLRVNADNTVTAQDAPDFRTSIDAPSATGAGASGTWNISILGNAATATNGVVTTGSYADPSWITSLAGSKISGALSNVTAIGVNNTSGSYAVLSLTDPSGSSAIAGTSFLQFRTNGTDAAATKMTILANGNVGIGANNPSEKLGVNGVIHSISGGFKFPDGTTQTTAATGTGTVTSVSGTGTVNGLTLTGSVTSSGSLTLGGTLTGVNLTSQVTGTLPVANGGTGQTSYTDGQLLIGNTATGSLSKTTLTAGSGITITNGNGSITIASTAGGGTVTSVAASGGTTGLTFTGSPITTTGTLTLGGTLAIANGGTGATTASAARAALGAAASGANSDITSLSGLTTALSVAQGGTGQTTYTNGQLLIGNSTGNTLTKATLTAGSGISITNGNGSITIAATGGTGTVTSVNANSTVSGLSFSGGPITSSGTLTLAGTLAIASGGTGATTASTARTNLGATTVGSALFTLASPNSIRFLRINADNTVTMQDAPDFRVSIDAPSNTGLNASGTWGINITGNAATVTNGVVTTGSYADPSWITSLAGSKISGNISGNAANVTGTVAIANGGTGSTTASGARTNLGATTVGASLFTLANPSAITFPRFNANNTVSALNAADFRTAIGAGTGNGTVTSVSGTGSANGLSLSGTVTSSGNITLSGSVTSVATNATIDGVTIGYRSIPRSTTSGTAVVGDVGKCIAVSAGITIPNATFAAGDAISIYNDSASAVTITQGASLTLRQGGTTNTGNRTLAPRGMATIWFNSASEAVITGAGVS